jgi:hypothetical protein
VSTDTGIWRGIVDLARRSGIANNPGSNFRSNATTASGGTSWHASGRAVDFMGYSQDTLASFFMRFPTLEVIHHSDRTGRNYASSGGQKYDLTRNPALLQQHRNHLHVAMSQDQVEHLRSTSILDAVKRGMAIAGGAGGGAAVGVGILERFVPNPATMTQALQNVGEAMASVAESAVNISEFAGLATRAFLPSNLIRGAAFMFGTIFVLIGVWFLAREIRESTP